MGEYDDAIEAARQRAHKAAKESEEALAEIRRKKIEGRQKALQVLPELERAIRDFSNLHLESPDLPVGDQISRVTRQAFWTEREKLTGWTVDLYHARLTIFVDRRAPEVKHFYARRPMTLRDWAEEGYIEYYYSYSGSDGCQCHVALDELKGWMIALANDIVSNARR